MFEKLQKKIKRTAKRITRRELSPDDVEDIIWDLRVGLLESDIAVPVADELIRKVEEEFQGQKIGIREDSGDRLYEILREAIREILTPKEKIDIIQIIEEKRKKNEPAKFLFVGVNGCGKTTTIAKVAKFLKEKGYSIVLAAADTFRAAGIEQLEKHGEDLDIRVIKHQKHADAAAVAYDAVEHAKARDIDVVLIDTAGRMQTDVNLMEEMKKISRVSNPDLTIFVGDALTGNDAVEQATKFEEAVDIDGSILTKMDADAKGGAALSIVQVTGEPILFLGVGQGYDDLEKFEPEIMINNLLPSES
ncbi:cell division protein FtsY [candidate division MSBL1 archaeon SCGC-AAA259I09]|uniref:Signal recognition particle receptor FtsY n=2 Tax=candidate division MSBL1 TaxID=215777 RepID=A0A133UQF5_9EURY|nr:cell division protein FtsY [candidate division MSBL1 archaeon SCGC-AAA259B11]KXA96435.1 cell division protein FtsY [candidate division MSBL1 archaeon SCGC-AAA259I09]